jgi:cation diffusion facilitator family transporter
MLIAVKIGIKQNRKGIKLNKTFKVLLISLIANFAISILKIIFGLIGTSKALVASGIQTLSDMVTDVFSCLGARFSNKKPTYIHPFGFGNLEYVVNLLIGVFIFILGINTVYQGVLGKPNIPDNYIFIITIFLIIPKIILVIYIYLSGKKESSAILIASSKESLADVIGSFVVIISSLLCMLSNKYKILIYADNMAMILVGIFIILIAYSVLKENISLIIGERLKDKKYEKKVRNIVGDNNFIIIKNGPYYNIKCEIKLDKNLTIEKSYNILCHLENELKKFDSKIKNVLLCIVPLVDSDIKK